MKIKICQKEYVLDNLEIKNNNLLSILNHIKTTINNSLAYRSGCRSGVCGSCTLRVNGVEKLACKTKIKDGDIIEPLKNSRVIKDLVVDFSSQEKFLKIAKANLEQNSNNIITIEDEKDIDTESNCILCNSCYSSCPVYEVNPEFIGPFALTRTYRYTNDKKESNIKNKIDAIQKNGIWDCTLCGNCNMVCPAHINITSDITKLRNNSSQFGYTDPNFANFNSSFDMGFDPSGGF